MKALGDISLVARVAAFDDKRAFDTLVRKYQSKIRRFFLTQTMGNEALSDDLAQETFIKAYTNIGRFRCLSGFSTWLYSIAYHVLLDNIRARRHTEEIGSEANNRCAGTADSGLKMDIYSCMQILKPDERTCVSLQLVDGLPIERIAEITGLPPGTVKSHLSRGKSKLAKYLKENGYD